ncbi:uncharacterized protein [Antennarius striatus]|uniref:uncharacterized protein isoform X2 n=1 Tax=Antennarius striatus TaxID=241820 RepID=UPI0035B02B8F
MAAVFVSKDSQRACGRSRTHQGLEVNSKSVSVLPPPPRVKSAFKATLAKVTPVSKATSDKQVTNDKPKTVVTAAQSTPPKSDSKLAASRTASDEKETETVVKTQRRAARPAPEKTTRSRKTRKQITATDAAEPAVGTRSRTTAASSGPPTTNTTALDSKEEVGVKQRRKRQAASPAVTTPVSKKLKPMESNSLKQKPENKQEKDQEEEKKSLESQGVKSNGEERDDKTVQEKPNQDCSEGEKEVVEKDKMESKSKGRKRKQGKDLNSEEEKQRKSNHVEVVEKAKEVTTKEKVEEKKPAEISGMVEKENQKEKTEIKQDFSKRGTRRQKRLLGKGRKRLMRKGADLKTTDINEENKEVTPKTKVQKEGMLDKKTGEKAVDEGMNLRKDGKEKKQTKDTGDNPEPEMMARENDQGIKKRRKKNKLQQEEIEGETEESEEKTTNMRKNDKGEDKMKKRGDNEGNKKEERVKKMERKEEKESCSVNEERQRRLAANRESLLKSLRGLLKAGRGRNRREAVKSTQKTGDGRRKKTEFKKMRSQKTADKNTVNESAIVKRSSINMKKEDKKESRMVRSMTDTSQIEITRKGKDEKEKGVKGNEQKTDKTTAVELRNEEKESRLKKKETNAERKKDEDGNEKRVVEMQNEETNQKDEKKNDSKIIGKIVKATAGTGAKVQLKAIMARIPAAVEDEKREKNVEEKLDSNKMEANKKTSEKINEKNKRGSNEEKKSEDKKLDTNVGKSERKAALTEDTKDKNLTDIKKPRKNVVGEENQNVGGKGKKTLEKNKVEQKATINEQEKRKEAEVEKIMTREQKKREGKSDRRSQKVDKVAAEPSKKVSTQLEKESAVETKPLTSSVEEQRTTTEGAEAEQASKTKGKEKVGKNTTKEDSKTKSDSSDEGNVKQAQDKNLTMTDSTLHRIHGDIRISLKNDNPDIGKCVAALDQLSMVYVTSKLIQRHSELVVTLRKLRYYRASQDVMDKASMLYNRFKNTFLVGEGEEMVSATFLRSLLEEKEREEAQRVEHCKERLVREELLQEVKRRMGQVKERRANGGGDEEADRAKRKEKTT